MVKLFTIQITVTRPYKTMDDEKIKKDYGEYFRDSFQRVITEELDILDIVGLHVEVKVK